MREDFEDIHAGETPDERADAERYDSFGMPVDVADHLEGGATAQAGKYEDSEYAAMVVELLRVANDMALARRTEKEASASRLFEKHRALIKEFQKERLLRLNIQPQRVAPILTGVDDLVDKLQPIYQKIDDGGKGFAGQFLPGELFTTIIYEAVYQKSVEEVRALYEMAGASHEATHGLSNIPVDMELLRQRFREGGGVLTPKDVMDTVKKSGNGLFYIERPEAKGEKGRYGNALEEGFVTIYGEEGMRQYLKDHPDFKEAYTLHHRTRVQALKDAIANGTPLPVLETTYIAGEKNNPDNPYAPTEAGKGYSRETLMTKLVAMHVEAYMRRYPQNFWTEEGSVLDFETLVEKARIESEHDLLWSVMRKAFGTKMAGRIKFCNNFKDDRSAVSKTYYDPYYGIDAVLEEVEKIVAAGQRVSREEVRLQAILRGFDDVDLAA